LGVDAYEVESIPETSPAERRAADVYAIGARRVLAIDNEQYVEWVLARFGVTLQGGSGFRAIAGLTASRVEYRRMDAFDVHELGERFDVALCFGILHRVTDPIALLRALADVLAPDGEIVLETYGSRLLATFQRSKFTSLVRCTRATSSSTGDSRRRVCGDWVVSRASARWRSSRSW
jgi:SAM-dependent methyltransferase